MIRHLKKSKMRHPPGDEIYRKGNVSMFEVQWHTGTVAAKMTCLVLLT